MKSHLFSPLLALALAGVPVLADSESAAWDGLRRYSSGADATPLRQYEELVRQAIGDAVLRRAVEADLDRVLTGDSTFEAKRFACQQLAVIGTETSVAVLAPLLKGDETAGIASAALAQIPSAKASAALRAAVGSLKGRSQAQVVLALGVRGDASAVGQLVPLTRGADADVAEAAVISLGRIASPRAQKAIAELRKDAPPALARVVCDASFVLAEKLRNSGNAPAARRIYEELMDSSRPPDVRRGAFAGLMRSDPDGGEKRALAALAANEGLFKPVAIAAAPAMSGSDASRKLAARLPNLEPSEQVLLVQALAERTDPDARNAVTSQLNATDKTVRLAAVVAVGQGGDASAIPALARAVAGAQDADELKAIELALAGLKGGDAVDRALMAQLRNRMAGPKTPFLAALVRRADAAAKPAFLAEAAGTDPAMARLGFQGLARVAAPQDLPAILMILANVSAEPVREDAETSVAQLLNRLGDTPGSSAAVRAALAGTTIAPGRISLLRLLPACADAAALEAVRAATSDSDPAVREGACRTLAEWPDANAWPPLFAMYEQAGGTNDALRAVALRGLARLLREENARPDAALIGRYRELLARVRRDDERKMVLGALTGCAHPDALRLALEQLGNAAVRTEAELAVRKIAEAIRPQHPEAAKAALDRLGGK